MKPMPEKLTGLTRRNQTYEVRFRVPKDIAGTYNKREVVKSLGTRDKAEAVRRYPDALKSIQADFDKHRADLKGCTAISPGAPVPNRLTQTQRRKLCQDYYSRRVDEERLQRHATLTRAKKDPTTFWHDAKTQAASTSRLSFWNDTINDGKLTIEGAVYNLISVSDDTRREALERSHMISDCAEFLLLTDAALTYNDRVTLALDLMATELRVLRDIEIPLEATTNTPDAAPASTTSSQEGPTFDEVLKKWLNQGDGKRWAPERRNECERVLLDFGEVTGRHAINSYTPAHGRDYKDILTTLPANWRKLKATRALSIKDAAEYSKKHGLSVQDAETSNGKLTIVGQFFRWAKTEFAEFEIRNPVENFRVEKANDANDERHPFSVDQLNKIFKTPPFTGAKSDRFWQEAGPHVLRDSEKFWLPLLGLFTGARLNELCQLTRGHIREHDGVNYIALTREMRLKKNPKTVLSPAIRNIPLHSGLLECGFLDFVRTREGRIFPGIPQHSSGRHSDAPSKWFTRLLKVFKIKTEKTSYHSFRHTFIAAATRSGVDSDVRERLVGHVLEGQAGRYGLNFVAEQEDMELLKVRNAAMQRVKLTGLDLGHLRQPSCHQLLKSASSPASALE